MMPTDDSLIALFDIGGTKTRIAATTSGSPSAIKEIVTIPTIYQYGEFLSHARYLQTTHLASVAAVGISFGVGLSNGIVRAASKMPDFVGRDVVSDLSAIFNAPVEVHHDCICVLGGLLDYVEDGEVVGYVTISTGIGAAVVSRFGDMLVFERLRIAHQVVETSSTQICSCGRSGCMATFVDSSRLRQEGITVDSISDMNFWSTYLTYLAAGIANFSRMFGLSWLFLGGGVTRNAHIKGALAPAIMAQLPPDGYRQTSVQLLDDEELAPLRGIAALLGRKHNCFREF